MKKAASLWLGLWFGSAVLVQGLSQDFDLPRALIGVQWGHPLGFDILGRDFFLTVLRASFLSASFATAAVLATYVLGITFGVAIAMFPRRSQYYSLRVLETFLAFPSILFALALAAIRGPGWNTLFFALLIGSVPPMIRLVYARTRELLHDEYIEASISMGSGRLRIARHHIFPAVLKFCLVKAPNLFAHALMAEATVSFLGVGAPMGHDTWGSLLAQGKDYLVEAPHIAIGAGVPLVLSILALQIYYERPMRS